MENHEVGSHPVLAGTLRFEFPIPRIERGARWPRRTHARTGARSNQFHEALDRPTQRGENADRRWHPKAWIAGNCRLSSRFEQVERWVRIFARSRGR